MPDHPFPSGPEVIIEAEQLLPLFTQREDILLIDLSKPQVYEESHLPGAVHMLPSRLTTGEKPAPGKMPALDVLSKLLSAIGLTPDKLVIVYDDEGGGWAGRLIWTLDMIGHKRYRYLNGGIHAWCQAGFPTETGQSQATASNYSARLCEHSLPSVEKEELLAKLGQAKLSIWDARSPQEFSGEKCLTQRGGHIPGAVNFEWTEGMDKARGLRIKDLSHLRTTLAERGILEDNEVITHCQTHHRSGFTYLLGKILGFSDIKAYPGSWSEWGNDTETPIEK